MVLLYLPNWTDVFAYSSSYLPILEVDLAPSRWGFARIENDSSGKASRCEICHTDYISGLYPSLKIVRIGVCIIGSYLSE